MSFANGFANVNLHRGAETPLRSEFWRIARLAHPVSYVVGCSGDRVAVVADVGIDVLGRWRIVEMAIWDQDALDLVELAFLTINADGTGADRLHRCVGPSRLPVRR